MLGEQQSGSRCGVERGPLELQGGRGADVEALPIV